MKGDSGAAVEGTLKDRVLYFADPMLTYGCDSLKEEFDELVNTQLVANGIVFDRVKYTSDPPFGPAGRKRLRDFDILFFDWGGAGLLGTGALYNYCRQILHDAQDHPSTIYVVSSVFTSMAVKEVMAEFMGDVPANIFLSLKDFIKYYKAVMEVREARESGAIEQDSNRRFRLIQGTGNKYKTKKEDSQ